MRKTIYAFFILACCAQGAYAQAPDLLTYQGRLKVAGQAASGNHGVEIFLCPGESGGGCVSSTEQSVAVSNGLFRSTFTIPAGVNFGSGSVWLSIWVDGTELTPRERLTSNAYSLFAGTAAYAENIAAAADSEGVDISSHVFITASSSLTVTGYSLFQSTVQVSEGNLKYGGGAAGKVLKSGGDGFAYWGDDETAGGAMSLTPAASQTVAYGAVDVQTILKMAAVPTADPLDIRDSAAASIFKVSKEGNVTLAGTVDGRDLVNDGAKLDGIASGATAFTGANAITAVEGEGTLDLTGDVTIAAAKSLAVDTISEKTGAAGVTIDGVLIKDGAIGAASIADKSVSDAEFQYLGNVTSDIQTQLNGKLGNTSTVPPALVGLSTVTDALAGKVTMTGDESVAGYKTFTGTVDASNLCIAGTCKNSWPFTPGSQVLQMGGYAINSSSHISAAAYQIAGSTVLWANNTSGSLAVGINAGAYNIGTDNTFLGDGAGIINATGIQNTFVGRGAGTSNTSAGQNVFVGADSGVDNVTGSFNAVLGAEVGANGGSFSSSTLLGYQAGFLLGDTEGNILVGYKAGDNLTTGNRNIIIGYGQDATAGTISDEIRIGSIIYGNMATGGVALGAANTLPTAALDVKSTGTASNVYAQVWRNDSGVIKSSMTSTGHFAAGSITAAGNIRVSAAGSGLQVAEGANARMGTVSLTAGTATVDNASVTANTRIFLTVQNPGGTVGSPYVSARAVGTNFTITSTEIADTSTIAWLLIEP